MKKIFALLLAVVMIFSFAACGEDEGENESSGKSNKSLLVGDWTGEFELTGLDTTIPIQDGVSITLPTPKFTVNLSFTKDTASFSYDRSSLEKYLDECAKAFKEQMTGYLEAMCAENGMTLDDLIAATGYSSLDAFLDEALSQGGFDSLVDSIVEEDCFEDAEYTYKKGKIVIKTEDENQEIIVKSLTEDEFVGEFDFGEEQGGVKTITFTK